MDNVDFLPERICESRARRRRIVRHGHLLAVCAAGLLILGYARQGQIRTAHAEVEMLGIRAAGAQEQLALLDELERQQAELMIIRRIQSDLGSRVGALDVLAELERIIPESIALKNLSMETMEVHLPVKALASRRPARFDAGNAKKTLKRVRLTITGLSPSDVDIANFIGQLSASPLFEDVNMRYARNVECRQRQAREFQASCYVIR